MFVSLFCACSSRPAKTIENLKNIVASEQNAAVRYMAFSAQAREEGFRNISNLFEAIARSEEIHACRQQTMLARYGETTGRAVDSLPEVRRTVDNLKVAIHVEEYEALTVFPIFWSAAETESAVEIAQFLRWVAAVAERHSLFCRKALTKLERDGTDGNVINSWSVCPECGCLYWTTNLEDNCILCQSPASSFILFQ